MRKLECPVVAQSRSSQTKGFRSVYRRIADIRRRMSRFGWKTDGILEGAEGRSLTQSGPSGCLRFQLEERLSGAY